MLTTAAENDRSVPEKAVSGLNGWIDCFEKTALAGTVFAGGVSDAGEIEGHPALKDAYDMGAGNQIKEDLQHGRNVDFNNRMGQDISQK